MMMPSGESFAIRPVDESGNYVQVLAIQSGNAVQSFAPSRGIAGGTFTLTSSGQTTAPIPYTATDPTTVATFGNLPVTPNVPIQISIILGQSIGLLAPIVSVDIIENNLIKATATFSQDNPAIAAGSFSIVNNQNGGAGISYCVPVFPSYTPTGSSISIRMTSPTTQTPHDQTIWVADGVHIKTIATSSVVIYDDNDTIHFSAAGFSQSSSGGWGQYYNGSFHAFPAGSGTSSVYGISASDVQTALEALPSIGPGNVQVTTANNLAVVEFIGDLKAQAVPHITSSNPAVAFAYTDGGFVPTLHVTHADATTEDIPCRQLWYPQTPERWAIYQFDGVHLGFKFLPDDTATVTIPEGGWMAVPGGFLAAGTYPVENHVGGTILPEFVAEPKTMGVGQGTQNDQYNSEGGPQFANMACRIGLNHTGPLVGGASVIAWDSDGDPTLLAGASAFGIVNEAPGIPTDGVGGIGILNVPNGLYTFLWDGPFAGGSTGGQHATFTERTDLQVQANGPNNRRVIDIQAIQSERASPTIYWNWNASSGPDGNGHYTCTTKNLRIYPPDPSDPTGQTPWLAPAGKFHPKFLEKCATLRVIRPMQALETFFNPIAEFDQYKPANWADRSGPSVSLRVQIQEVRQYTGPALDNPHTLMLQFTTVEPINDPAFFGGFFNGQSAVLEHCGTVQLSTPVLIGTVVQDTFTLGETENFGAGAIDVIDDHTFVLHAIKTGLPGTGNVDGVTMTNVLTKGDVAPEVPGGILNGAARGAIGTSWPIQDVADFVNELKTTYPDVPRCLWFNVPVTASPACRVALGTYFATHLLSGITVRAELGNECWNFVYSTYSWLRIRNFQLFGFTDDTYAKAYAAGQVDLNSEWQAAFDSAGRGSDFIHVFATQSSGTANTNVILEYAASVGAQVDEVAIAPYVGNFNPGLGPPVEIARANLFTPGMCLDLLELNTLDHGYSYTADNRAAINAAGYPDAKIVAYEGGWQELVPGMSGGASSGNGRDFTNLWPLQHAIHRHPRIFGISLYLLQSYQDVGITTYTNFFLCGGSQAEAWSTWEWCYQQPGTGDPSENPDYRNASALTSGGQVPVVSQVGGAWNFWNSLVDASASNLMSGVATAGSTTDTTASATATDATLGTTPYAYQWYRSTIPGQTGAIVSGQTTLNLSDSGLSPGTTYYYKLRYTDAGTGSVYSNQVAMTTTGGVTPPAFVPFALISDILDLREA
jgi:hypothetical protein